MIVTVAQLITLAADTIGAINVEEGPTAAELSTGLSRLNMMLDAWSVDTLTVRGALLENFPIIGGTYSYTIGIGATFNTPKPSDITEAFIRDTNNLDTPLDVVSEDEWMSYSDKAFSPARPESLYYDKGPPQQATQEGIVWIYPIPDQGYTLFFGEQAPLTEFSNLTDVVSFEAAYYEALLYNLAVRLFRSYFKHSQPIPADIVEMARESMRTIERMNDERQHMVSDVPRTRGPYNIYTDQ